MALTEVEEGDTITVRLGGGVGGVGVFEAEVLEVVPEEEHPFNGGGDVATVKVTKAIEKNNSYVSVGDIHNGITDSLLVE